MASRDRGVARSRLRRWSPSGSGFTAEEFPLARVLEGGTWAAGRIIAREKRADGGPAISDLE